MKKIILFDTSIASSNKGDEIIMLACEEQLESVLSKNYVIKVPTHTPVSHWYQNFSKFSGHLKVVEKYDYKFICGTNLLNANMLLPTPLWNINACNCKYAEGSIAVGVGLGSEQLKPNRYTKNLLSKVLSSEYIHSTRDEKTAEFIRNLGLKAINTGCPTTWNLTNDFCLSIPKRKKEEVVFTLTDYARNPGLDKKMVYLLSKYYRKVYFWVQGLEDLNYFNEIYSGNNIEIVYPSVDEYDQILAKGVDYVGTRLHAGIRALQKGCRAIIISIDNRTRDMNESINLCTIPRERIGELERVLFEDIKIQLNIKENNIKQWLAQFE